MKNTDFENMQQHYKNIFLQGSDIGSKQAGILSTRAHVMGIHANLFNKTVMGGLFYKIWMNKTIL